MILLVGSTHKLQIVTTAALALDVDASWLDNNAGAITPGSTSTAITTAVTTDVVAAPTGSQTRNIQQLSARNKGAGSQTVTVQRNVSAVLTELFKCILAQDEVLAYEDGTGFFVTTATGARKSSAAPGQFIKSTLIAATGTHTTDPLTRTIKLRAVGGGGQGGGGNGVTAGSGGQGGGGGSGGYGEKTFTVAGNVGYSATIGAGGSGGAAGAAGGNGGTTSFVVGGTAFSVNGGTGGTAMAVGTAVLTALGGAGGTSGGNGDLNGVGEPGQPGIRLSGTVGQSGGGGSSELSGGAIGVNAQGAGVAATGKGGGGSGGCSLNAGANTAGGNGAIGAIIVDEYT